MPHPQQHHQQRESQSEYQRRLEARIPDILNFKQTKNINELLDELQEYVRQNGGDVTTHQLRNIFSKIKTNRTKTARELHLVRPQLAYVAARQASPKAKDFVNFLENIIRRVTDDSQVEHFVAFFEAIVAYHKLYHGNKKQ